MYVARIFVLIISLKLILGDSKKTRFNSAGDVFTISHIRFNFIVIIIPH